jgi:Flp pilus assembly protein TadD
MRRTAALVAILFTAALARAEETNAPAGAPPSMRGSAGEEVRPVDPPPPAPVPVDIPSEAEPVVSTDTVEKMGMDGIVAFEKGNFQGAKEAYVRVLKVEPNNLPALVNLGSTEYRLGNNEEAERLLRRSLQIKPDNPTAWLNLGMVYLGREEPMRALASIAQAVVHAPGDPVARNYLGVAAGRNRWFDAAESELRRAIELRPDYADAHFNLAVFCLERVPPATELAKRHYREALRLGAAPDPLIEKALAK